VGGYFSFYSVVSYYGLLFISVYCYTFDFVVVLIVCQSPPLNLSMFGYVLLLLLLFFYFLLIHHELFIGFYSYVREQ
jgi:hypothetical protein